MTTVQATIDKIVSDDLTLHGVVVHVVVVVDIDESIASVTTSTARSARTATLRLRATPRPSSAASRLVGRAGEGRARRIR